MSSMNGVGSNVSSKGLDAAGLFEGGAVSASLGTNDGRSLGKGEGGLDGRTVGLAVLSIGLSVGC